MLTTLILLIFALFPLLPGHSTGGKRDIKEVLISFSPYKAKLTHSAEKVWNQWAINMVEEKPNAQRKYKKEPAPQKQLFCTVPVYKNSQRPVLWALNIWTIPPRVSGA